MNAKRILTLARKDLMEVGRNKAVRIPIMIVPLIFVVILPLVMITVARLAPMDAASMQDVAYFVQRIPGDMGAKVAAMSPGQALVYVMLGYMLAPLFLVMPLMFSTIISADAFAGERERKTLEALLYTSASDSELFMGKVAAGLVPSLIVSWLSFAGYTLVLNLAGNSLMEGFWFPLPAWYVLIFWITPALATLGIAATVLISLKVNTFMEAYQMSASLVVLVLAMMAGQMTGVLYFDIVTGLVLGAVVWLITALLIWIAVKRFRRTQLISRL